MDKVSRLYPFETIIHATKIHHHAQALHESHIAAGVYHGMPISHHAPTSSKHAAKANAVAALIALTTATFLSFFGFFPFIFRTFRLFNDCSIARDFASVVLNIFEECFNFFLQSFFLMCFSILVILRETLLFLIEDIEVAQFSWFVTNICGHLVLHFGERSVVFPERH